MPQVIQRALRIARCCATRLLGPRYVDRLAKTGNAPIPVFFYHRIANSNANSWSMSESQFERQVNAIADRCEVIGLDEVQRRIRYQQSFAPAAAITFDDGYADNNRFALPFLVKRRIPCTYFVSVENITTGNPFPHDLAAGCPLQPNTVEDLRYWANSGVEIGLHTRTHFDFSKPHDAETIDLEIVSAKAELERIVGKPIRYFAFPYGLPQQLSPTVINAVANCGMSGFCSAFGAYNVPGRDDFHIRRVHGDVEDERFYNWLFFDKRKLKQEPQVQYQIEVNRCASAAQESLKC